MSFVTRTGQWKEFVALLIFVAAWDLREEELYFKFMVKIMEAILANQLLPFAYHAFRESE
jgi:palmitoyltransferase